MKRILCGVFALALCACAPVPVRTVNETIALPGVSRAAQVKEAILRACLNAGWECASPSEDTVEASLMKRVHMVLVEIKFDARSYCIVYKRSKNMHYADSSPSRRFNPNRMTFDDLAREQGGQAVIHRKYNTWVQTLNNQISWELEKISLAEESGRK